jgi:hypothetical protein
MRRIAVSVENVDQSQKSKSSGSNAGDRRNFLSVRKTHVKPFQAAFDPVTAAPGAKNNGRNL